MNILLGYAYDSKTTGVYFERSFRKQHNVFYCGTNWGLVLVFDLIQKGNYEPNGASAGNQGLFCGG